MFSARFCVCCFAGALWLTASLNAQLSGDRGGPASPHDRFVPPHESIAEVLRTPQPAPGPTTDAWGLSLRGLYVTQVNLDSTGMNITGDAANEPSITVDPSDPRRLAIGWRQFDTIASSFRQAGYAYSRDAGRTWTFPGLIEPGIFRSDPVLASDSSGTFYYYSLKNNFLCDMFTSTDGGATWSPRIPAFGGDKAWFTIDRTGSMGDGHVYISWSTAAGCCDLDIFTRSTDGGMTYMTPISLPSWPVWGTLDVNRDGYLFISGLGDTFSDFRVVRSTNARDAGVTPTFGPAVPVALGGELIFGGGPNPGGLLGQAWVAVDRSGGPLDGNVYLLCSVDPPGPDPLDVRFARSSDGGQTWSASVRVNDDPAGTNAWQWFGTMSVAPDGRIDVVWNDTRDSGQTNISRLYHSSSHDGGVTWSVNVALTPAFDSFVGWPNQDKLGDYYHMVSDAVGASLAFAATFNGEQDVYFARIGDFDCNGNGVGDADDISTGTSDDANGNGIPDECECLGDVDGDGDVDFDDLVALLAAYGSSIGDPQYDAAADLDASGTIGFGDLVLLLGRYGTMCS